MPKQRKDHRVFIPNGTRWGELTYLGEAGYRGPQRLVQCRCACGALTVTMVQNLLKDRAQSCRRCCYRRIGKKQAARKTTHGQSRTATYRIWTAMHHRCKTHPRYAGRSIRVCRRWAKFENFLADMGVRPSREHSIERKNNNGNYTPTNCVWATDDVQNANKSNTQKLTLHGETLTHSQWAKKLTIPGYVITRRAQAGWPAELILRKMTRSEAVSVGRAFKKGFSDAGTDRQDTKPRK